MSIKLNNDFQLVESLIDGKEINDEEIYYVATNDYLYNGGDNMAFFRESDTLHILDYKVRNALIDYFKKVDTLNLKADNRFIKAN